MKVEKKAFYFESSFQISPATNWFPFSFPFLAMFPAGDVAHCEL